VTNRKAKSGHVSFDASIGAVSLPSPSGRWTVVLNGTAGDHEFLEELRNAMLDVLPVRVRMRRRVSGTNPR